MEISISERNTGKFLSYFRQVILFYEFLRITLPIPEGNTTLIITAVFSLVGLYAMICQYRRDWKRFFKLHNLFAVVILVFQIVVTYICTSRILPMLECWLLQMVWFTLYMQIDEDMYDSEDIYKEIIRTCRMCVILSFLGTLCLRKRRIRSL